jgi:transcription-repair coupling factor (superfamily II helicase)
MASVVQDRAGPSRRAPARPLAAFLRLANRDASLAGLMAGAERTVAIAEPAQAFTVAAVAEHGARRPVVVAVPSATAAARLTHEIGAWLGPDQVAFFPAWETLPFERVSPGAETMGRRLELMWRLRRLRDGAPDAGAPAVIVSPVRALLQRLGPHVEDVEPVQVAGGQEVDLHRLVEELVGLGYRREYQVEHRGELAVRGSIVDVFPSTAAGPVRIDLWGDEVDRLTEFSVADQRSVADID